MTNLNKKRLFMTTLLTSAVFGVAAVPALAQSSDEDVIIATGTRIVSPGIVSSSPINTIDAAEFELKQVIEVESLFRDLPTTIPGDGQNTNNGTSGIATVNLRSLGTNRTLILMDGKRMTPFDVNGRVDLQTIPANLIESVDIVTGGASAVYGSDAMAGAINFRMKDDFEGVTVDARVGSDKDGKARTYNLSGLIGGNFGGGAGNAVLSINHSKREALLLGDRDLGLFGVSTSQGPSSGGVPASPGANCDAPNATAFSSDVGSTTAIPTAFDLPGGTLQFQNDGTLEDRCSLFNFNPFNYYQTPSDKFNLMGMASFDINDNVEAYATTAFTNVTVRQQVAPSGIFGTPIITPLGNPFINASARQSIIDNVNTFVTDTNTDPDNLSDPAFVPITFDSPITGVIDSNNNGMFDVGDSIEVPIRRRTLELGARSSDYDQNTFRFVFGLRGDLPNSDWNYDVSFQRGQTDVEETRRGYTNLSNIRTAVNTISATECTTPDGVTTSGCVPINLFGPFGAITPEAAAYSSATAILKKLYSQNVFNASFSGPLPITSPMADSQVQAAFGFEYREESGETIPDECLKLAPASCQGGAGGNVLPIKAGFDVYEVFGEAIIPLITDRPFIDDLSLELGGRASDYSSTGSSSTWKAGANWSITPDFRVRVMQQQATRAPNIGELGSPVTQGLANADFDYCSAGNTTVPITAEIRANCVSTGMLASQVGRVADIVSGQINVFAGTNLADLPDNETADTFTVGFVYRPSFLTALMNPTISVDYYDIVIEDYIGEFSPQEILDACYIGSDASQCSKINRINGSLGTSGSGINLFTTNLDYVQTEGVDVTASAGYDLGGWGELRASTFLAFLMTQESQSNAALPKIDCLGLYGADCSPTPEFNANTRVTWLKGPMTASVLWRHLGEVNIQEGQKPNTFDGFESIDAYDYFDFTGSYDFNDTYRATIGVRNIFDNEPPVIGNNTGTTSSNSGNTFPSTYDILGRTFTVGLRANF